MIGRHAGVSNANRQWVVTAYALAFGSLLLLGGRIADYVGRRRMFVIGLIGFAAASALGGLAPDAAILFGARGPQGARAALLAAAVHGDTTSFRVSAVLLAAALVISSLLVR